MVLLALVSKGFGKQVSKFYHVGRQSTNGCSLLRVQRLLGMECCRCRRGGCFKQFTQNEKDVKHFLDVFWSMEKTVQESYDQP